MSTATKVSPAAGQRWQRIGGRERVEIMRAWNWSPCGAKPEPAVRCRPLHGGREWCAYVSDFLERFESEAQA